MIDEAGGSAFCFRMLPWHTCLFGVVCGMFWANPTKPLHQPATVLLVIDFGLTSPRFFTVHRSCRAVVPNLKVGRPQGVARSIWGVRHLQKLQNYVYFFRQIFFYFWKNSKTAGNSCFKALNTKLYHCMLYLQYHSDVTMLSNKCVHICCDCDCLCQMSSPVTQSCNIWARCTLDVRM